MSRLLNTYQLLLENSLEAVLFGLPEGQIIKANPAACTMFGMTEAELCASGQDEIIDTSDSRYTPFLEERIRLGRSRGELKFKRKDGSTFEGELTSVIQDDGQRTVITIRDNTERKRAEAALWENREHLKQAEEIARLGSWELDLITNALTWTDGVYRIFGLQPQKFGATYEAFLHAVHPEDGRV